MELDIDALQMLPAEESDAQLVACTSTCSWTCSWTSFTS
ncbi:ALQxL family class IV lanthipeptide [Actinocrinis puniceicyclus]|uniref:ALQxL family class IV lanthipeptide n=1 Tax=Actinocrinis puniceicyclus TaxID=977794 RepID=A0A8J7WQ17_9ACTN|nr:ALQxL family class IV lanthipeptide [Actinocrinis puniceicyclus]MBS2965402.1 ALQxL family class IV lanthipeptide [Actinocrinis puniceicyclus]MBS2965403.1 ALQxL family class IV lanthipeptide [Actinocrinis puniceicyclus]